MPQGREERLSHLLIANKVRSRRSEIRHSIRQAPSQAESLAATIAALRERESAIATMTIGDLLLWTRHWGEDRVRRFLLRCQVSEGRCLGDLTERQVRLLAAALERERERLAASTPHAAPPVA